MNQIKVSSPCYLVQSPNTYIGIRRPPSTSISRLYRSFDVTYRIKAAGEYAFERYTSWPLGIGYAARA